jgi:hypothetical protein
VTYNLNGLSGTVTSAPVTSQVPGVTGGAISRAPALTAVSGSGEINASGWGQGSSADAARYYTFTLSPASGCTLSLTSLTIDTGASATGPASLEVATSVDAFATHKPLAGGSTTLTLGSPTSALPIEVRVYGFAATASGGTLHIQSTMSVAGGVQ